MTLLAERVDAADLPFVVPLESRSRYVGTGYVEELSQVLGGTYVAGAGDIGIVASLDELAGPSSTPVRSTPLVREFYEHTTRYTLDIVPRWRAWVRPGYLLYRTLLAPTAGTGQRADEPARGAAGVRSRIDTITPDPPPASASPRVDPVLRRHRRADLRRHLHDLPARRPGVRQRRFPLPQASFTATLLPRADRAVGWC